MVFFFLFQSRVPRDLLIVKYSHCERCNVQIFTYYTFSFVGVFAMNTEHIVCSAHCAHYFFFSLCCSSQHVTIISLNVQRENQAKLIKFLFKSHRCQNNTLNTECPDSYQCIISSVNVAIPLRQANTGQLTMCLTEQMQANEKFNAEYKSKTLTVG